MTSLLEEPNKWMEYMNSKDVYEALRNRGDYTRDWLELCEILHRFPISVRGLILCPPDIIPRSRTLPGVSGKFDISPRTLSKVEGCLCLVPDYTEDILGSDSDEAEKKLVLGNFAEGASFVFKLPRNCTRELYQKIVTLVVSFASYEFYTPYISSPIQPSRYLVCMNFGLREPPRRVELFADVMMDSERDYRIWIALDEQRLDKGMQIWNSIQL